MIQVTDLKNGTTFLYNKKPCKVIKYTHTKIGRGGATIKLTSKNLISGSTEEMTFGSNQKVEEVNTIKKKLQFLYKDSSNALFMDPTTFEQVEIPLVILGDQVDYIKDGENVNVLFWNERPLSVELPPNIVLTVTETDPGVKGNSAVNIYKPAILDNGLKVKVPLFINQGDKVKIDTRTGEYVERAK